jgi:DNA adenine methylase
LLVMTQKEGVLELQRVFNINHIYSMVVFSMADKKNLIPSAKTIIDERPKPFVKWVGGKRQLVKQFRDMGLYPPPPECFKVKTATYYEPFVGGGAVFFDLSPMKAVLSDMNFELVTSYNVIKNNVEGLIRELRKYKYSKEFFLEMREKNPNEMTDLKVAARFIYLNRTCFNGLYRVNSKGKFNTPFGKYDNPLICDAENLRKISKTLQKTKILHQSYKKVLDMAKKGDFVYFDPPYYPVNATSSFTSYTKEGFFAKEQEELRDIYFKLHKRGCFVMLSNSDTPLINKLYSGLDKKIKVNKVDAGRAINANSKKRGKIKEVLVINY